MHDVGVDDLLRLVYLYTMEDPPVYRMVNEFLADRRMWQTNHGCYHGHSDEILPQKEYQALGDYAVALIQALFALNELGFVVGRADSGVSSHSEVTLFRGIPPDVDNPYHAEGSAYLRKRWTTFCSTTSIKDVASQFGEVQTNSH